MITTTTGRIFTLLLSLSSPITTLCGESSDTPEYGVDVSFPMHYLSLSTNYPWLSHNVDPDQNPVPNKYKEMPIQPLGNRQQFYDDFIKECADFYGKKGNACYGVERDRMDMSLKQPQSMVNYTENGFKKIKCPEKTFKLVKDFWEKNKNTRKKENWFTGNTYTNHWKAPTHMVSVEDTSLRGGGSRLKQQIWDAARDTIQEWTGEELTQCSLYGVRVYEEGAVLATHVDRLPLVSSAIINVDQDVDEPWPLEVIGHDGKAYNVTMEPGDMVLYESHSVLHGRPFPLKGRFFANLFVHFEPTGHSLRHHGFDPHGDKDPDKSYAESVKKGIGGHEGDHHGLPSYVKEDTPWERRWRQQHPGQWEPTRKSKSTFTTGSTEAHTAAAEGNVSKLKEIARDDPKKIHQKDVNGWKPIHEGARGGHEDVISLLVGYGSDINERTQHGKGASPLFVAEEAHGHGHRVVKLLKSLGALSIGPEL